MSEVPDTVIRCVDVRKRFGEVTVLNGVDLDVRRGEFVAVTGGSGSGKSTLLHLLAALDRPTSGQVRVNDHDLSALLAPNRYRRSEIGLVFQLHNLLPRLSASENVQMAMFGTHRSARERRVRAQVLLDDLHIGHLADRSPTRLSGGERQRVAIARALANDPALLLADEPTGSLDHAATGNLLSFLDALRERSSLTMLVVTHDDAVAAHADRRLVLEGGRIQV